MWLTKKCEILKIREESLENQIKVINDSHKEEIAKQKMTDLNARDIDEASKIIAGSARSMGIEVKE